jgi:hypothetical protein
VLGIRTLAQGLVESMRPSRRLLRNRRRRWSYWVCSVTVRCSSGSWPPDILGAQAVQSPGSESQSAARTDPLAVLPVPTPVGAVLLGAATMATSKMTRRKLGVGADGCLRFDLSHAIFGNRPDGAACVCPLRLGRGRGVPGG